MADDLSSQTGKLIPLPQGSLCFGPFRFDMRSSRLYRGGIEVHLAPKASAVLTRLLAHCGHTVSKDEFFDTVWNGVNVSDESLTQAISTVRQALGDAAHTPEYIQTVSGAGYRFIAAVAAAPNDAVPPTGSTGADPPPAGDLRGLIKEAPPASPPRPLAAVDTNAGGSSRRRRVLPWVVAAASIVLALGVWGAGPAPVESLSAARISRFIDVLPAGRELYVGNETLRRWGAVSSALAWSPSGAHLAYVAREADGPWRLYLRTLAEDASAAPAIPGSAGASSPFFSPDGEWLGFSAGGQMHRVHITGGLPQPICETTRFGYGASWGPDDLVAYDLGPWKGLGITSLSGPPQTLTGLDFERHETSHLDPVFLPGGQTLLYTLWPGDAGGGRDMDALAAVSRTTGTSKIVLERASAGRYLPPGYLVFVRTGQLQVQAFDASKLEVSGAPRAFYETERSLFAVSPAGDLAYIPMQRTPLSSELVWVDHTGAITKSLSADRIASQVQVSPSGDRLALSLLEPDGVQDIWVLDTAGRADSRRITFSGVAALPSWSPDGKWVVFKSNENGPWQTFRVPADGTGDAEFLIEGESSQWFDWHPHEPDLVFGRNDDIWIVDLESGQGPRPLLVDEASQGAAEFSPDGKWLLYTSGKEGQSEIFVSSYPDLSETRKVSQGGGEDAHWAPDGSAIFYRNRADHMMAVAIDYTRGFSPAAPEPLFALGDRFSRPTGGGDYDIAPDGRFVFVNALEEEPRTEIVIVRNWVEELKELLPAAGR